MKQTLKNLRVIMISSEEVKRIKQSVKDKMIRYGLTEEMERKSGGGRSKPLAGGLAGQTERLKEARGSGVPNKLRVRKHPMGPTQKNCNGGRLDTQLVGPDGTKSGGEASGTWAVSRNGRGWTEGVKVSSLDQEAPSGPFHVQTGPPAEKGRRSANPPVTLGQPPSVSGPTPREGWRRGTEVTSLVAIDPRLPLLERLLCGSAQPPFEHIGFGPLKWPCPTGVPDLPSTNQLLADPPLRPQPLPLSRREDGPAGGGEGRPSGVGESGPAGGHPSVVPQPLGAHQPPAGSQMEKKSNDNGLGVKQKPESEGQGIGAVGPPAVPGTRFHDGPTLPATTIQSNRNQDPVQGPGGGVAGLLPRELGDSLRSGWAKRSGWRLGELNDRHNATAWGRYAPPEAMATVGVSECWHDGAGILRRDIQGLVSQSETPAWKAEEGTKAWEQEGIRGMTEAKVSAPLCTLAEVADLELSGQGCPSGVPIGQGQMLVCNDPMELGRRATWPAHPTLTDNQILVGPYDGILQPLARQSLLPSWLRAAGRERSGLMGQVGSRTGRAAALRTGSQKPQPWGPLAALGANRTRQDKPDGINPDVGHTTSTNLGLVWVSNRASGSGSQEQPGAATPLAPAPTPNKGVATLAWVRGPQITGNNTSPLDQTNSPLLMSEPPPVLPKKGEAKVAKRLQPNDSWKPSASSPGNRPRWSRRGWRERKRKIKAAGWAESGLKTGLGISGQSSGSNGKERGTGRIRQQYSPFDRGKLGGEL